MSAAFWREVGVGLLASVAGAVVFHACRPWLGAESAFHGIVLLLSGAYVAWLLRTLHARSGRLLCIAAWGGLALALPAFDPSLWAWCAAPLVLVWLIRSLYRYPHLSGAALDALLTAFALAAAVMTARHSGSLLLALWCLFLLQALYVFIPARSTPDAVRDDDAFDRAHATAEAALQRLAGH